MPNPLVSVICLCYNHASFLEEALASVVNQTYNNIQIIVVDDCSTDNSVELIKDFQQAYPQIELILHSENTGNCLAFNEALKKAKGKFIIDFATDDVMLTQRVEQQVNFFLTQPMEVGVIYSNSQHVNEDGSNYRVHFKKKDYKPEGDVFNDLLEKYYIEPSSMMVKTEVMDKLGGYNADLAFEDFDFWVRSSRSFQYAYQDEILTKRRRHEGSLSTRFSDAGENPLTISILKTCDMVIGMIENDEQKKALARRIRYELRFAYRAKQMMAVRAFYSMLKQLKKVDWFSFWIYKLSSY